jgi:AsmA protein
MKILKIAGITVGALLLLLVVGAGVLLMVFDPNDYKGEVQKVVRDQTGRELALPGKISLSLFPDIALSFGPATLGNASGFGTEPMLQLERVRLGVKLRPLFSKRVEVSSVEIARPVVRLQVDKSGRDNWSDISEHMKQNEKASTPASSGGSPLSVQVASLRLSDGELSYADARDSSSLGVTKLQLRTGELASGKPVDLDTGFDFTQSSGLTASIHLKSTLTADLDKQQFSLAEPAIDVDARGGALPKEGLKVAMKSPALDLDLMQQTLSWPKLQIDAGGAKLAADIRGRSIIDAPAFSGTLALAQLSLRDWLPRFGIAAPVTSDPAVLKRFALDSAFEGTTKSVKLSRVDMQLDDSKLTGTAGISDFDSMAMQFDLLVDRLDAERYMAPAPPKSASSASKQASPPVEIPVELLRALNMRGNLRVGAAKFAGVQFSGLRVGVDAAKGRVHLAPLEAGMYGGQYRGDINVDATGVPRVSFNDQVTGVDFAPLAKDWLETNKLSGRGNFAVKANATGKDSDALLRTLAGNLSLKVDNGAFEGVDLLYEIRRARALLKKQDVPQRAGGARTVFNQLAATATIDKGVVSSNDLVASMNLMKVTGKGSADLVASQLDWRLDVAILKAAEGRDLAPDLADAVGFVIPVRMNGPLTSPTIRPDLEAMAKAVLQQKVDEKKQELQDKLKDQLNDKLKGLFNR